MGCFAKFNPHDFLECHTNDAINVLKSIKEAFPWLEELSPGIWRLSFYSVLLHDLGKCSGFQKNPRRWGYRHEVLSVPFAEFLNLSDEERKLIALAILTHHRTLDELKEILPTGNHRAEYEEKVEELLRFADYIEQFFLPRIPYWEAYFFGTKRPPRALELPPRWGEKIKSFDFDALLDWYDKNGEKYKEVLTYLRGILNASDHLASAGELEVRVLPDIADRVALRVQPEKWRPLQKAAGKTIGNLILRAPTGYGKTEAALLWANLNAYRTKRGISSRIFYVLPYKASINAMHQRLLGIFSDPSLVGVLHSSSGVYLYSSALEYRRLSSLYHKIYTPFKVTTPFQIIKAFFGVGFYEMTLTELTGSLLIFDEIHAYEPNILGIILAILELLKQKRVKTLVMTATLPDFIEELLKEVLKPRGLKVRPEEADRFTRHRVNVVKGSMDNVLGLIEKMNLPRPSLIACNSVGRAIEVHSALTDAGYKTLLLHSRFTYGDREEKERELMARLNDYDFVVATQVVEVSLDVSFASILTEPAPLDALIQRFGRVNRRGFGKPRDVYILTKGSEADRKIYRPYSIVDDSLELLTELDGEELRESLVPELVSEAYYSVAEKLRADIEEYRDIAFALFENLKPLMRGEDEKQFYEMFQGLEVVPGLYQDWVRELLDKRLYMEVYRYLVPIPYWLYFAKRDSFHRLGDKGARRHILVVELEYTPELGLLREPASGDEVL